jgi:hypothetical protein
MDVDYSRIQAALVPGERVIWWGRPDPTVNFGAKDLYLIPFSLLWGGFAIFWEYSVVTKAPSSLGVLWGIPFVAIGLFMIVGRFFYKRYAKRRTLYALTESRAVVVRGSSTTEVPLRDLRIMTMPSRNGRHLSVRFGQAKSSLLGNNVNAEIYANTGMDFLARSSGTVSFFDVADVVGLSQAIAEVRVITTR